MQLSAAELDVLYEDKHLFVINKSAGIHSVIAANSTNPSVAHRLCEISAELESAGRKPEDGGLVQRLDFETSGCLLGAKSREIWDRLHAALAEGIVEKTYIGLAEGRLKEKAVVQSRIGAPHRGSKKVRVYPPSSGRKRTLPANSEISPFGYNARQDLSLVRVLAHPARRHQVRAHLAHLGHPLCGDALYGSARRLDYLVPFLLHAEELTFKHPIQGSEIVVRAPAPKLIQTLFNY